MFEHIMERLYDVDIVERIVYLTIIFTVTQLFLRGIEYEEAPLSSQGDVATTTADWH